MAQELTESRKPVEWKVEEVGPERTHCHLWAPISEYPVWADKINLRLRELSCSAQLPARATTTKLAGPPKIRLQVEEGSERFHLCLPWEWRGFLLQFRTEPNATLALPSVETDDSVLSDCREWEWIRTWSLQLMEILRQEGRW